MAKYSRKPQTPLVSNVRTQEVKEPPQNRLRGNTNQNKVEVNPR